MKTVLITGATGFIGGHLVKRLAVDKANKIYCLVRDKGKADFLRFLGVEIILGDITRPDSIKNLPKADEIYHLAGKLGKAGVPDSIYWDLHVGGTKNLVAALDKSWLKKFFFFSSPSVAGPNIGNTPWGESAPYNPTNIYEKTKAEAEKFLLGQNLPLVIIRPEFVYGPGDKHVLRLIKAIGGNHFPIIGSGKSLLQPTYIDDVIRGIEMLGRTNKVLGQIYHLAGREKIPVIDYAKMAADILNVRFLVIKIPKFLAYFAAFLFEIFGRVFGAAPVLSFQRVRFFTQSHTFSTDKIARDTGWRPEVDLREGLRRTILWNKEHGCI